MQGGRAARHQTRISPWRVDGARDRALGSIGLRCCYALRRIRDAEPRLFGSTCGKSATRAGGSLA